MSPFDRLVSHALHYASLSQPLPEDPLSRRDSEFIGHELGLLGAYTDLWFSPEVSGLEHIPDGPALVVGTHNGGTIAPDMFCTMVAFWRHFGPERASYGLAHDQVFRMPGLSQWLWKIGAVPAKQEHARALLERGATVLVYPGGDVDAFKSFRERHVVKFGGRRGFVRTALATGAPIVPVVSVGAHETVRILTDGSELASALGLKRLLRVEVWPVILCLPWGIWLGPFEGHVPAPSKIKLRVLPAMRYDLPRSAAEDNEIVTRICEEVRATMQIAVDDLAAEGGYGVRARFTGA